MTLLLFYFIYASDWLRFFQKCVDILSSGLKIPRSHLTWKFGNKCLNVREWAEVVGTNEYDSSLPQLFREFSVSKKTLIGKKFICMIGNRFSSSLKLHCQGILPNQNPVFAVKCYWWNIRNIVWRIQFAIG